MLAHIVDVATMEPGRDPISDIEALEHELDTYAGALDMDSGLGDLRERPRLVVLNKMDIPEAKELAEFLRADIEEQFGWPVYLISTATREGLDELKWAMWDIVKRARAKRKEQPVAEPQVIRPAFVGRRHDDAGIEVARDPIYPEGWLVTGEKVERWVRQTDFENDEAVGYLSDRLNKAGVEELLRKQGAREGDTVTIGEISFDWEPSIGGDPTLAGRGQDARLGGTDRTSAAERKRASQARRGLIDEYDYGTGEEADRERWQG